MGIQERKEREKERRRLRTDVHPLPRGEERGDALAHQKSGVALVGSVAEQDVT